MSEPAVTVVGIGADGWAGLTEPARRAVEAADVVFGGTRQLAALPAGGPESERVPWPSPLVPALPGLLAEHRGREIVVLASGDPMFYGVGTTLVRLLGGDRVRVLPHPSSISLACARLGWAMEEVEVVSAVGRPLAALTAVLTPGRRILLLSAGAETPARVMKLLAEQGHGDSDVVLLERLGGPDERVGPPHDAPDPLNIVAVECRGPARSSVPGLPDDAYEHDGQLTKREVRAVTLARLAPVPGELLWDVGGGSGSIAIEWMRAHRSCRAVTVEARADRAERITANAAALGVPGLRVVHGRAPAALAGLATPDAIFIGGGITTSGMIETCWDALPSGGRLVANAVTLEGERVLADAYAGFGGDLVRIAINRASPVGGYTGWRAMMPVTQWTANKP
ncbi:cobalamin biosynthesis bifunctional protein CbiET [Actinomadura craniellae]|uniref:Cobalamin biosynthesis bifunctional protein CbiET n=1 Tax=Actinomadura craniellae TaxID=2231787 RepID=A0A365HCP6_9ACTN|nr:precorrin-6y C5,15-methyltransferase (decarboxylating) subunit CbiE [Actinomadura craniellae]RAY16885.1 cobalamin biosynthesis bifunctional protein CbiET [Actinomadura craniellae]